jgi:hypothetical protein
MVAGIAEWSSLGVGPGSGSAAADQFGQVVGGADQLRKQTVEPVIGQIKQARGFRQFLLRGFSKVEAEWDVGSAPFESVLDRIETGDLRPILQISGEPIADHPSLRGVPLLGGRNGVAARRAKALGRDVGRVTTEAAALDEITGAGRLVVGPKGLEPALVGCLVETLSAVAGDPAFEAAAGAAQRTLDFAPGPQAEAAIAAAARDADDFIPILRRSIDKVRR